MSAGTECMKLRKRAGFTLIETLVAVTLLTVAIVAPMTLATQSLSAAYYARDQITAFYLAQEAIEAVRSIRDGQILQIVQSQSGASLNIFGPIPLDQPFRVDARKADPGTAITRCDHDPGSICIPIQTDGTLYGYDVGWTSTRFTRTLRTSLVGSSQDEIRVTVEISWQANALRTRTFSISTDLYRWIDDGATI